MKVSGTVVNQTDQAPIAEAMVTLRVEATEVATLGTDRMGRFEYSETTDQYVGNVLKCSVTKDGFLPGEISLKVEDDDLAVQIALASEKQDRDEVGRYDEKKKFTNWYIEVLKKYAVFNGRARRKEYWYFVLFSFIISIILMVIDNVAGSFSAEAGTGLLGGIYTLAVLIPGIAVAVRRLHDTDRSGWWVLISLIPLVGAIVFLVFMVQDSKPGENQYGSNPKAVTI